MAIPLWPAKFLQRNQLITFLGFLRILLLFFSCCFYNSIFIFPFCHFNHDMSWCGLFEVILFGSFCASCTWISVSFFKFGNFSAIFLLKAFFIPPSLYSPSRMPILWMLAYLMLSQRSYRLLSFFVIISVALIELFPLFYIPRLLFLLVIKKN